MPETYSVAGQWDGKDCAKITQKVLEWQCSKRTFARTIEFSEQCESESPKVGAGACGIWGGQGGSANAPERNKAPGGSTARATRAWRKHALLSSETM